VLGEALSCGTLCVATDVGDSKAIIGPYGRIVAKKCHTDLAGAWRAVLSLGPKKRGEIGVLARRHVVENYSLSAIGRAYADLYASVV
jgi:glycosyltransferase involved in cell wall biosynthesis